MSQTEAPHEGRTHLGKAVILIVIAAVIAILVLHHGGSTAATGTTNTTTPTTTTSTSSTTTQHHAPLKAPSKVKVQVLNGLLTGSLAGNLTTVLKSQHGYDTLTANNTTRKDTKSQIYVVTHGYLDEGRALARKIGLPKSDVHRGVPADAPFPAGVKQRANLVVVIGTSLEKRASSS